MNSKRTIIYCRESRDDYGEKAERIETQRDILLDFCKRRGLNNIIGVVMDDNVSGTKFERFNNIIEMAKNRQVDVLVFKDASRLGRNLRESLNFIHILEECSVEVLFESEAYDEAFFPLLAWFNEQRAREDSQKVRRVFKHKMETGELVIKPVYGYDKQDNKLIVNLKAAEIIKQIYNLFLEGYGACEIATELNYQGTPTPSQMLFEADDRPVCCAWNRQHIYRILTNRVYTGDMVYSKVTKKSFKSKKVIRNAPEEWIIVPNHHEAIISREVFEKVQQLRGRAKAQKKTSNQPRMFSGLIVCGRCGSRLIQRTRRSKKDAYTCGKYQKEGRVKDDIRPNYGCVSHLLLEEDISDLATDFFSALLAANSDEIKAILADEIETRGQKRDQREIAAVKKNIAKYEAIIERIYDDLLNGGLPETICRKKLDEYTKKLADEEMSLARMETSGDQERMPDLSNIYQTQPEFTAADISNRDLKRIFHHITYFLPGEITRAHTETNMLDEESFQKIYLEGGVVFTINEF